MNIITNNYSYEGYISNYDRDHLEISNQENEIIDESEKSSLENSTIDNLPLDLKELILSFCNIPEINSCLRLSKNWNTITDAQWSKIGKKFENFYGQEVNNKEQIKKFINFTKDRLIQDYGLNAKFSKLLNDLVLALSSSSRPPPLLKQTLKDELLKLSKSVRIEEIDLCEWVSEILNIFIIGDLLQKDPNMVGVPVDLNFENFNSLNEVFDALEDLTNLCHSNHLFLSQEPSLAIISRNLTSLSCKIFDFFPNLISLDLKNNSVSLIQKGIEKSLLKLESLDLSGNQMTSFPIQITKLTTLKVLKLGRNNLSSLPIEILQLKNLEDLELVSRVFNKNKKIEISVPDEFWQSHLPSISRGIPTKNELWWMKNEHTLIMSSAVTLIAILLLAHGLFKLLK